MNRDERRAEKRRARREMTSMGCTCHPTITNAPADSVVMMRAAAGFFIRHDTGCVFGDEVAHLNRLGVVPTVLTQAMSRCAR